jgi:hypothetical protein
MASSPNRTVLSVKVPCANTSPPHPKQIPNTNVHSSHRNRVIPRVMILKLVSKMPERQAMSQQFFQGIEQIHGAV